MYNKLCLDNDLVVRGCRTKAQFQNDGSTLDCHSVSYQSISATGCYCQGDLCNGGGFSLSTVRKSTQLVSEIILCEHNVMLSSELSAEHRSDLFNGLASSVARSVVD